jgi:hypothetical protein
MVGAFRIRVFSRDVTTFSENENILRKLILREYLRIFSKTEHLNLPEHFKDLENVPGPYCQCVRTSGIAAEFLTVF